MALFHYFESITNTKGDALTGFYVKAVNASSGLAETIYADTSLTPIISVSGLANAAQVDDDGNVSFYTSNSTNHIDIYQPDGTTFVDRIQNVSMGGPLFADNESIPANVKAYGAVGDNSTPDAPAVGAAISQLQAAAITGFGYSIGGGRLLLPKSQPYYMASTPQDIFSTIRLEGEGVGEAGGGTSILRWAGSTGFRVQRYNTTGDSGTNSNPALSLGGDASILSGMYLRGGYATTEAEQHGVFMRARASVRDMFFDYWPGDAIRVDADSLGTGGVPVGNANSFEITKAFAQFCRNGIYVRGGDTNAGLISGFSAVVNRAYGIRDDGFLGSTYVACHTASNGLSGDGTSGKPASAVSYLGNCFAVKVGQETAASTAAPPATQTSDSNWIFWKAGAPATGIPAWVSGMSLRAGGGYCTTSASGRHVFLGCYSESDQPPSQFSQDTLILGGMHGAPVVGGGFVRASLNKVRVNDLWSENGIQADGTTSIIGPTTGATADSTLFLENTNVNSFITGRYWTGGVSTTIGSVQFARGTGLQIATTGSGSVVRMSPENTQVADFTINGLELQSGKVVKVAGSQVVGPRVTGWSADTGTARKAANTTYAAGTTLTYSATYVQSEQTAMATRMAAVETALQNLSQTQKALKDALIAHGSIGA